LADSGAKLTVVSDYPRLCPKCRVLTDRDGFAVDRSKASSRKSHCRRCDTERALRYHYKHAERISARKAAKRAEVAIDRELAWRMKQRQPGRSLQEILAREET
jgi:hypothetical protein